jgi:hypothetical protein
MKHDDLDSAFNDGFRGHWWDNHWAFVFWMTVILACIAPFAFADTLTYQSQTLPGTNTEVDGPATFVGSLNDVYTVTVTVSGPLAPNLNNQMITPTAWVVTCQFCLNPVLASAPTLQPNEMSSASAVFMFSTDATGKITAWNFAVSGNYVLGDGQGGMLESGDGMFSSGDNALSHVTGYGKQITQVNAGPKGTWTQSSLSNPAPAVTVLARTCNSTWAAPNNNVAAGLTPNANGTGMNCRVPSQYPPSWYIKVTSDGGKTYEFVTLQSLGLGN